MPAKVLVPTLFALGIVLQWLMLRFAKSRKRFLAACILPGIIILSEAAGMLGSGLAEIIIVCFTWALLLGMLLVLAAYGIYKRLATA